MPDVLAFVITAHGYGHASRQMEVIRELLGRRPSARAVVFTAAPESIFRNYLDSDPSVSARVTVVPFRADVGLVQRDGLAMDRPATLRALEQALGDPRAAARALAEALAVHRPAVIVGDIPPTAFAAAAELGVPSVAAGNFDWAFIYQSYAAREPAFAPWAELSRSLQSQATAAVHLAPGPPLTGFGRVVSAPPLARALLVDPAAVRASLRVPDGDKAVLVSFGGFGLSNAAWRVPPIPGITWILAPPMEDLGRPDTRFAPDTPYLALIAACDAVFTKPGYGIVCEAARYRTRLLYTDRGDFPEYPWLVRWLDESVPSAHVPSAELGTARGAELVAATLASLFEQEERWPPDFSGAGRVASVVESLLP